MLLNMLEMCVYMFVHILAECRSDVTRQSMFEVSDCICMPLFIPLCVRVWLCECVTVYKSARLLVCIGICEVVGFYRRRII